jgi:hypothetical protein
MQEATWYVDISKANDISHYKRPKIAHGFAGADDRLGAWLYHYVDSRSFDRGTIKTQSRQMLSILKLLVLSKKVKSISLEDDYVNHHLSSRQEEVETLQKAVDILLAGGHLKMIKLHLARNIMLGDGQMLHDAIMRSRATVMEFGRTVEAKHMPFLSLAIRTHPTLKNITCYETNRDFDVTCGFRRCVPVNYDLFHPFGNESVITINWPYGRNHRMWNSYQDKPSYLIYCMSHARVVSKLAMIRSPRCENIKFQGCDFSTNGVPDLTGFSNIKRVYIIGCLLGDFESGDATGEREGEKAEKKRKRK